MKSVLLTFGGFVWIIFGLNASDFVDNGLPPMYLFMYAFLIFYPLAAIIQVVVFKMVALFNFYGSNQRFNQKKVRIISFILLLLSTIAVWWIKFWLLGVIVIGSLLILQFSLYLKYVFLKTNLSPNQ
jgi:hypothetical protein